jgi:hypothetical protein
MVCLVFKLDEGVVAMEVVEGSLGGIIKRMGWRLVRREFNGGGRSALAAGASGTLAKLYSFLSRSQTFLPKLTLPSR